MDRKRADFGKEQKNAIKCRSNWIRGAVSCTDVLTLQAIPFRIPFDRKRSVFGAPDEQNSACHYEGGSGFSFVSGLIVSALIRLDTIKRLMMRLF